MRLALAARAASASASPRADVLRLRGRFRGRRGLVAFLAVMGPGLIAGIAGNDAGGITTYSVMGATTGPDAALDLPDHDRHPGHRPGDGRAARRRHRPGPVRPDPRPVRGPPDGLRDGRPAGRQRGQHRRRVLRGGRRARDLRDLALPRRCRSSRSPSGRWSSRPATGPSSASSCAVIVVFLAYIVSAVLADPDWGEVGRALVTPSLDLAPARAAADGRRGRHDDHAVHAVLPDERRGREGHRRRRARARAGRRDRRLDLDQRHRDLHRRRGGEPRSGSPAGRSPRRRTRRKALEPVAGRLAEALFAVGLFGASVLAATIMPLSTAFVICEAFGWESGVDKRFADARAFFSIYTFVLAAGALVVLIPGLDLLPLILALAEPAGPAAAGRARVHGPARQRPAADGRPPQRPGRERARLVGGRDRGRARRRAARGRRARACSGFGVG